MDDEQLLKTIHYMGIDHENYPIVALLPLVQVAWADGSIHEREKKLILKVASQMMELNARGSTLLHNWLSYRPTDAYLQAGREVLITLSQKTTWDEISLRTIDDVVGFSWDVAKAAGGLFGIGSVDRDEKQALHSIVEHLQSNGAETLGALFKENTHEFEDDEDTDCVDAASLAELAKRGGLTHISFHLNCPARDQSSALLIFENEGEPVVFPVAAGRITIGRSRNNEVQLRHDPFVSKHHCRISNNEGTWHAEDLQSANGTTVNGQHINLRPLLGGERFKVGETYFDFVIR